MLKFLWLCNHRTIFCTYTTIPIEMKAALATSVVAPHSIIWLVIICLFLCSHSNQCSSNCWWHCWWTYCCSSGCHHHSSCCCYHQAEECEKRLVVTLFLCYVHFILCHVLIEKSPKTKTEILSIYLSMFAYVICIIWLSAYFISVVRFKQCINMCDFKTTFYVVCCVGTIHYYLTVYTVHTMETLLILQSTAQIAKLPSVHRQLADSVRNDLPTPPSGMYAKVFN